MDWQTKFLNLYMSQSVQDFSTALELKRAHIPAKLYRYRPLGPDSHFAEEICEGTIYLAHPKELNDPFDSCSLLKSSRPAHYFKDQTKFRESMRKHFDEDTLSQIFDRADWYDELMRITARESAPSGQQDRMVQVLNEVCMTALADFNHAFNHMLSSTCRLACFTTKPDNLPMWNHYANGHQGICLEYEPSQIASIYMVNRLFPVFYSPVLPDMAEMSLDRKKPAFGIMDFFLLHKLSDWSYESEWRLIYNAGSWYPSHEQVPPEFWTSGKVIQFIRPSRVLLGAKINAEYETLVQNCCEHCHIPVSKMEYTEYGLERHPI